MPPARFLRDYWQKHPLLIRGAFPHFHKAISPQDLAGLACEEAALARIVIHEPKRDRWTLRTGPFAESDFAKLPSTHWTLLVQDVDKWDLDVAALLDAFAFIPSWRVDDVMVSYAAAGGGVGAHVDQYDVFLVQGTGQRRWRISMDPHARRDFRDDAELRLLREFSSTHDWVLESGDALYLPPNVPHEGTAIGECMTFSVGMRAPSQAELLLDFSEFLAEPLDEAARYADPGLRPSRHPGEIDIAALARVGAALPHFSGVANTALLRWFGCFITRYRAAHMATPRARVITPTRLATQLPTVRVLRNPFSRFAWARQGRGALLFVAGECHACSVAIARTLCAQCAFDGAMLARLNAHAIIAALANGGHLQIIRSC
ncbi:MAG: cupin domain-containing protein [Xanthomonadaceae bacterium]|nr:cupin domain-containing protein [Xanthomonadaceae bacterium]MDE2083854.1 cupin domain-containing protein [Xanthomonadaceae bacterium]